MTQDKTVQDRTVQGRTVQGRTVQGRTGRGRTRASLWVAALAAGVLGATGVAATPALASAGHAPAAVAANTAKAHGDWVGSPFGSVGAKPSKVHAAATYVTKISTNLSTYSVGDRILGYVTLNRAAGPKGVFGKVTSNIPGLIPGGSISGTFRPGFRSGQGFMLTTDGVKGPVTGTITVTIGGHSISRKITINNVHVVFISTDKTSYGIGERIEGFVTLNGTAGAKGIGGKVTSNIPGLIPGGSISGTFPAGFHSGQGFMLTTDGVKGLVTGTITVTIGGHSASTTVTIG